MHIFAFVLLALFAPSSQDCSNFELSNSSSYALGNVRISSVTQHLDVPVTNAGSSYITEVCFAPTQVTISTENFVYPNGGTVQLSDGHIVEVGWSTSSLVEVFDFSQESRPLAN